MKSLGKKIVRNMTKIKNKKEDKNRAWLMDHQPVWVSVVKDFLYQTTKRHVCSSSLEPLID